MANHGNLYGPDFTFLGIADSFIPNDSAIAFSPYQAALLSLDVSFVPGQKYMREPYRKVVLGSKWPTFSLNYERGIPRLFGSDVDHEYLQMDILQTFKIGTLGTSSYRFSGGKFLSSKKIYD